MRRKACGPNILCDWLGLHAPSRDGSWIYGYDFVCRYCLQGIGRWPDQKLREITDKINAIDDPMQQNHAAEFYSKPHSGRT